MSDQSNVPSGQVSTTPEGGPPDEGTPATAPGAGQVQATPEAGPLPEDEMLVPPTWSDHLRGPILGLDDEAAPSPPASSAEEFASPAAEERAGAAPQAQKTAAATETARDRAELKKWPPYTGKPVSDVSEALRYAAPVVAQAEKLAIQAIGLSGRSLSRLARYLEARRTEREVRQERARETGQRG